MTADSEREQTTAQGASGSPAAPSPSASPTAPVSVPPAPTAKTSVANSLIPIAIFAGAGLLFFIVSSFWTNWQNAVAVKTDDAYVRADVAPLSTKSAGVVEKTAVDDFAAVKKGQVLVELQNQEYHARVEQAEAAAKQSEVNLADMKERKEQQDARVAQARAVLESSKAGLLQADDGILAAEASVREAKASIEAAKADIDQSHAAYAAATSDSVRTHSERARQEALVSMESATRERLEQAVNEHERAVANQAAHKASEAKAQAELAGRQAQLAKANQLLASSRSDKTKSIAMVADHEAELTAQIKARELLDGQERQLVCDVAAKKAAVTSAKVDLNYTYVCAPTDGIAGELKVKPGQLVSAGTQVITVVSAKPWVIANFRETQLTNVREGDSAVVEVDALPDAHLKGHVEKIAPASGAQFSLLPPENASGNFTKVTQRIPVKIALEESEEKLIRLRPGMSVVATISPSGKK
jgi:membrane fusion protein (multidrug efflux system)